MKNHNIIYLIIYVDDIIIKGSNELEREIMKARLENNLKLKDQENKYLGIEVSYSEERIYLSLRKYTLEILDESGLLEVKRSMLHMERHIDLMNGRFKPIKTQPFKGN